MEFWLPVLFGPKYHIIKQFQNVTLPISIFFLSFLKIVVFHQFAQTFLDKSGYIYIFFGVEFVNSLESCPHE
jgi:hypothetical protein